jgi:hypothetical protein
MGVRRSPRFCLIQRCSVSFSRKFRAGIVPDALACFCCGVRSGAESAGLFVQEEITREFPAGIWCRGDNLSCAAFTLDII